MPKNITVDAITTDDITRVSPDDVERLSKYKVQVGDIIYSRRGDVEKCARITETEDGWLCGTGCLRVRIKPTIISTEFLHAYLCHPVVREWIVRHAVGATMPNLNTSILSALPVVIPNKSEMTAIGSIWLTISDQIRLNSQINQTLEQMALAIFKSWFVDFEPVKAKIAALEAGGSEEDTLLAAMQAIAGKGEAELTRLQAEQPEQYAELRATADLLPSAMQDSELGEIPEGWDVKSAESQFQITIGKTPPRKEPEWFSGSPDHVKWLSIRKMGEGNVFATDSDEYLTQEAVDKFKIKICPEGTVLLSFKLTLGRVVIAKTDMATNEAIAHFRISTNSPGSYWTYLCLSQFDYSTLGSTSSIATAVNSKTIKQMPLIIPDVALLQCFEKIVTPIFEGICNYQLNKASLANLRDSLLPKLLSGELSLSDAEGQLAEEAEPANV